MTYPNRLKYASGNRMIFEWWRPALLDAETLFRAYEPGILGGDGIQEKVGNADEWRAKSVEAKKTSEGIKTGGIQLSVE